MSLRDHSTSPVPDGTGVRERASAGEHPRTVAKVGQHQRADEFPDCP